MAPIRVAIVGLGKIARDQHLGAIEATDGIELVAVASRHAQLDHIACFHEIGDLLASDVKFDAVSLCTPPVGRFEQAKAALDSGKHVMLEKPFLSGEANMSHTIANLEHHNFKYDIFRQPGDLHVHFFGTATLSFSEGIKTEPGDVFEISAAPFKLPLVNRLTVAADTPVTIKKL